MAPRYQAVRSLDRIVATDLLLPTYRQIAPCFRFFALAFSYSFRQSFSDRSLGQRRDGLWSGEMSRFGDRGLSI